MINTDERRSCAEWINSELQPDIYAVGTLKIGMKVEEDGLIFWAKGSRQIYENEYSKFHCRLARELYGKTLWGRFKQDLIIRNAGTLEGSAYGGINSDWHTPRSIDFLNYPSIHMRPHINMLIRRPENIPFFKLKWKMQEIWKSMDWAMEDIFVEQRTGDCASYSLKEGTDSLLLAGTRF